MIKHIHIWWPVLSTDEDIITVEIPDDIDPDEWLSQNRREILEEYEEESYELSAALEVGYAGAKFIEIKEEENNG